MVRKSLCWCRRNIEAGTQTSIQVGENLRWEHPLHVLECSTVFLAGNMLGSLVSSAPCNIWASLLASYFPKSVFVSKVQLCMLHGSAKRRTRRAPHMEQLSFVCQVINILKGTPSWVDYGRKDDAFHTLWFPVIRTLTLLGSPFWDQLSCDQLLKHLLFFSYWEGSYSDCFFSSIKLRPFKIICILFAQNREVLRAQINRC